MSEPEIEGFSPCPGCDEIGFSIQAWKGEKKPENQLMQCSNESCRVDEYKQIRPEQ